MNCTPTRRGVLLLTILSSAGGALAQGSRVPDAQVIVGVKIVTGTGAVIEKGRIVVRDGRIAVLDDGTDAPADARRIDGTGLTAYPGFIDGDVVAGITAPPLVNEGPKPDESQTAFAHMRESHRKGIRPDVGARDLLEIPDDVAQQRRQAGFALGLFTPPAATIGGKASLADLSGRARRESIVAGDVAMCAALAPGAGEGYPVSTMGAVAHFRQTVLDADWQRRSWKAYEQHKDVLKPPTFDPLLAALEPCLDRRLPVAIDANTSTEILRALAVCEELGLRPWIVGGKEAWKCAPVLAAKKVPVLLSLQFGAEPKDAPKPESRPRPSSAPASAPASGPESAPAAPPKWPGVDAVPDKLRAHLKHQYQEAVANAAVLAKAGVMILFTTRDLKSPGEFHGALAKAVEQGLPREAALDAVTKTPAELFGAQAFAGALAVGRPAYITIVKGAVGDKDLKVRYVIDATERFDFESDDDAKSPAAAPDGGGPRRRRPRDEGSGAELRSGAEASKCEPDGGAR